MRVLIFLGFLALSILVPVGLAQAQGLPDLQKAEALVKSGNAEEAWKLLSPHEFDQAGKEDFDYLLGIAALDSGRADKATLIFERVLAVNPNHAAARLDMARAYFALGDYERARGEFEAVKNLNPPAAALATIQRYLAAIDGKAAPRGLKWKGFAEATVGTDGNVNAATNQSNVYFPFFGATFTLSSTSVGTRDDYASFGAGGEATHAFNDQVAAFAVADLRWRVNSHLDVFDTRSGDVKLGLQVRSTPRDTLRLGFGHNAYYLDNARYREIGALLGEWRRDLDHRNQFALFGQYSRIRYQPDRVRSENINQELLGAVWLRALETQRATLVFGSLFLGRETATDGRTDGDKDFYGVRAGGQIAWRDDVNLFGNMALQHGNYSRRNILFQRERRDWQYDLAMGVDWRFAPRWSLKPQAAYTRSDSNLAVYDYKRYDLSLTLRRDFD